MPIEWEIVKNWVAYLVLGALLATVNRQDASGYRHKALYRRFHWVRRNVDGDTMETTTNTK